MTRFLQVVTLSIFLFGCASLTTQEKLDRIQLGVDVVYLDDEYELALESLLFNNFTEAEEAKVSESIAELQLIKDKLEALKDPSVEGVPFLLTQAQSTEFLDQIALEFNTIRAVYEVYLEREGLEPDPLLAAYYDRGVRVWYALRLLVTDTGGGVAQNDVVNLLRYIAQGYIFYKTGGTM